MKIIFQFLLLLFLLPSCEEEKAAESKKSTTVNMGSNNLPYSVKMTLVHDPNAFTQGLDFVGDKLYESTGGQNSWIAEVDLATGKQNKKVVLAPKYFGEGITVINKKIYQLTWRNKEGFVYDVETFKQLKSFNYETEGWGLTNNGSNLIMSDGTSTLYFLDTTSLKAVRSIHVKENDLPIDRLNELEYINGYIFANRWETDYIYKIDPASGEVVGKLDLSPIANEIRRENQHVDVLNGIAYNENTNEILITGKWWPKAYILTLQ